jgi:hypothetical protein
MNRREKRHAGSFGRKRLEHLGLRKMLRRVESHERCRRETQPARLRTEKTAERVLKP